ncbi:MAG TPA: Rrf2 family transcriptional regulator [Burkholderiales bacterium]|nr:Rrf2 family transcriptional regulator [Burkholderiales bacterium]
MKLQKNTMLALCGVLEFAAQPGRQLSTAEIAGKYGASPHHLAKVLGRLRRAGLVKAARGSGGGYRFSGNAKRVTLLDVIAIFENVGAKPPRAPRRELERAVDQVLAEIDATARATFSSITLETMLKIARRLKAAPSPES